MLKTWALQDHLGLGTSSICCGILSDLVLQGVLFIFFFFLGGGGGGAGVFFGDGLSGSAGAL